MNKRIRELAEQSGLKVESWTTNPPKPFQILGGTEQFEKFAELIINRIIDNVQCHGDLYNSPDIKFICENIVNSVKFDFGVEE